MKTTDDWGDAYEQATQSLCLVRFATQRDYDVARETLAHAYKGADFKELPRAIFRVTEGP